MAHVRKRILKNGSTRWLAAYRYGDKDITAGTYATKTEALTAAALAEGEHKRRSLPTSREHTVGELIERWRAAEPARAPGTESHRDAMFKHVIGRWGDTAVGGVHRGDAQQWATDLAKTLAPSTVRRVVNMLSRVIEDAVRDGVLTHNPVKGLRTATPTRKDKKVFTRVELDAIADAMPTSDYRLLVRTLGLAGLRPSEAVALTVADFDPDAHTLRVSKATAEVNGVRVHSKGKTRAANRTVTVPPSLTRELRAHVDGRNPRHSLFVTPGRTEILRSTFNKQFKKVAAQLGHEGVVLYDLRKTAVSLAFAAGATLPEAMARFGHVDARMALEAYASTFPDSDARLAERLDAAPEDRASRRRSLRPPSRLAEAMKNSRSRSS